LQRFGASLPIRNNVRRNGVDRAALILSEIEQINQEETGL
jgi:hypothetical protein